MRACGLLVLIVFGSGAAVAPAQTVETFRGKAVRLERSPGSQARRCIPSHPIDGEAILAAGRRFAVEVRADAVRVASRPDGPLTQTVRDGKMARLGWDVEEDGRKERGEMTVGIAKRGDGSWIWFAADAVAFEIGDARVTLVDANADGRYDVEQDAWLAEDSNVACPLAASPEFVIGCTRILLESIEPDGSSLRALIEPLRASAEQQLEVIEKLNAYRLRNGLLPVQLDEDWSMGCTEHANYLAQHGWTGFTDPRQQNLGPDGASEAGARAAARAVIGKHSPAAAPDKFWRGHYSRIPIADPTLSRIGVNASPADISVIDIQQFREAPRDEANWIWSDPVVVPAEGALGVETHALSESPREPVSDLGSRGMPIMAIFRRMDGGVEEFRGRLEEIGKGRVAEVPVLIADPGTFANARGIIPAGPLKARTRYRATLQWKQDGAEHERVVEFTTR